MRLTCVRHGQTAWNAIGRFQGQSDIPLDIVGREEAEAVRLALRDERFDSAVASDLVRAAETAGIILRGRQLALVLDARWRELDFGAWDGLAWSEVIATHPELPNSAQPSAPGFEPPGGESFDHLTMRISAAFSDLTRSSSAESVLIVTHAGPLHALMNVLGLSEALSVRFLPGSISCFVQRGEGWVVEALNRSAA